MPIVKVELWPGRTQEQKAELARAITDAVVNIAHPGAEGGVGTRHHGCGGEYCAHHAGGDHSHLSPRRRRP